MAASQVLVMIPGHRHKIGHLRLLPGPSRNLTPPSKQARDIYFEHICIHIPTLHETWWIDIQFCHISSIQGNCPQNNKLNTTEEAFHLNKQGSRWQMSCQTGNVKSLQENFWIYEAAKFKAVGFRVTLWCLLATCYVKGGHQVSYEIQQLGAHIFKPAFGSHHHRR